MDWSQVARLRERADELEALAARVDAAAIHALVDSADDRTWSGPGPTRCRELLTDHLRRLHQAADDLRSHAGLLERQAHELEVRLVAGTVGVT